MDNGSMPLLGIEPGTSILHWERGTIGTCAELGYSFMHGCSFFGYTILVLNDGTLWSAANK